jgi:hypothetical protein
MQEKSVSGLLPVFFVTQDEPGHGTNYRSLSSQLLILGNSEC